MEIPKFDGLKHVNQAKNLSYQAAVRVRRFLPELVMAGSVAALTLLAANGLGYSPAGRQAEELMGNTQKPLSSDSYCDGPNAMIKINISVAALSQVNQPLLLVENMSYPKVVTQPLSSLSGVSGDSISVVYAGGFYGEGDDLQVRLDESTVSPSGNHISTGNGLPPIEVQAQYCASTSP